MKMKFTKQQMVLFDNLKREGKCGRDYDEIISNVFCEYVRQTFGTGGL